MNIIVSSRCEIWVDALCRRLQTEDSLHKSETLRILSSVHHVAAECPTRIVFTVPCCLFFLPFETKWRRLNGLEHFQIRPMGICPESQSSRVHWVRRFFAVGPISTLGRSVTHVGPSARCQQRQNLALPNARRGTLHPSR